MDLISQLPKEVIHRILDFLSTKEAVRISILSKTWRREWESCPALDLSLFDFILDKHNFMKSLSKLLQNHCNRGLNLEKPRLNLGFSTSITIRIGKFHEAIDLYESQSATTSFLVRDINNVGVRSDRS